MKALQYIYTSWKNGDSAEKGYMIYSKSEGITDAECTAIKDAMRYLAPKGLSLTPSAEEIAEVFPYSFAYFVLPGGRRCVAQSTYLGKDYSGRYGNYIIYALVFEKDGLICRPAELFAESFMKTFMTEEELNAASPVPPLPVLNIEEYGTVINDEQLTEILYDKENEFAQLLSCVIEARDKQIPFYINDTRENLVIWAAAVSRVLPKKLAGKFQFITYAGDHEILVSQRVKNEGIDFGMTGVRPDANYFNYAAECKSSRHIVIDFMNGSMTEGVAVSEYAKAMSESITLDYEEIEAFGAFIDETSLDRIDRNLSSAYEFYRILKQDVINAEEKKLADILRFGQTYANENDNGEVGSKILVKAQEENWVLDWQEFVDLWVYANKYTNYMIYSLYDLFTENIYQHADTASDDCKDILSAIEKIKHETPEEYKNYLTYQNSSDNVEQMILYLNGHTNICTNMFYIRWLMENYSFANGIMDNQPVSKLFRILLGNICKISKQAQEETKILLHSAYSQKLFESVFECFMEEYKNSESWLDELSDNLIKYKLENSAVIEQAEQQLFHIPAAVPIAIRLSAKRIAESKEPEEAFWRFYNLNQDKKDISVLPMVTACLDALEGKESAACHMMERLDSCVFEDKRTVQAITDIIENMPVKTMAKMERKPLQNTYLERRKAGLSVDKVCAVTVGKMLEEGNSGKNSPLDLVADVEKAEVSLDFWEKSDYECYLKNYLEEYVLVIRSEDDVNRVMRIFYHGKCNSLLISEYISVLKRLKKKDLRQCQVMAIWTCVYLLNQTNTGKFVEEFSKAMTKYLKGYSTEEQEAISQKVSKKLPENLQGKCTNFFEEVKRKEGFTEKIGGFFHKKG